MNSVIQPFLLSLIAGLATGIGGIVVLLLRRVSDRMVSLSMGFASGVMLMVAFNNLFLEAEKLITHIELITMFSLGAVVMIIVDLTIPHIELTTKGGNGENARMARTGALVAVGITLHNVPEASLLPQGMLISLVWA